MMSKKLLDNTASGRWTPLNIQVLNSDISKRFQLTTTFTFYSALAHKGTLTPITVSAGFRTDLGSVPWFFRRVVHPSQYPMSFTIHDWLYSLNYQADRRLCDMILAECLALEFCGSVRRQLIYNAVRIAGKKSWREGIRPVMSRPDQRRKKTNE